MENSSAHESKCKDTRYLDIHEDDQFDEEFVARWIRQASELPGWVPQRGHDGVGPVLKTTCDLFELSGPIVWAVPLHPDFRRRHRKVDVRSVLT